MSKDLSTNNIAKLFLRILPVQIFVVIASSLSSLINGLFIGNNLSSEAMVALGFVTPLSAIIAAIVSIFSGGAGILCGKFMGSGEKEKLDKVFSNSLIALVAVALFITLLCEVLASPIASLLGASSELVGVTSTYIRGLIIGTLPTMLVPCLMVFLQMCNESNFSLISTILLAVFNLIFGLINVKVFNGGIFGIGVATSLSYFVVLVIIAFFFKKKNELSFDIKDFDKAMLKELVIFGFPSALANILYAVRNMWINNLASNVGGAIAIGALAIFGSFCGIFDSFNIGVCNASKMLASVFVGERDSNSLKKLVKHAMKRGFIIGLLKVVSMVLFAGVVARLFSSDSLIIEEAKNLLILYSLAAPLNMLFVVVMSVYQCFGKVTYCNILYIITCIIAPISCCYIAPLFMGINGVWICYVFAEVVIILVVYLLVAIKKKSLNVSLDDLLLIDSEFEIEDKYSKSINSIDEVINISNEIEAYCLSKNIDKRRSMLAGLCVEEMAGNIVDHGFKRDNKKHTIDTFLAIENDDISIRLRDDCVAFDPKSKIEMMNPSDPCKNIGIKMVAKVSKDMNYQTTFGMNVLTIKL